MLGAPKAALQLQNLLKREESDVTSNVKPVLCQIASRGARARQRGRQGSWAGERSKGDARGAHTMLSFSLGRHGAGGERLSPSWLLRKYRDPTSSCATG